MTAANTANPPNWKNRTIFTGDNLYVLRGLNTAAADLVYLDPPFNKGKQWAAPIGSEAAGAAFRDTWRLSDIDQQWHEQIRASNRRLHDVILAGGAAGGDPTMSYLIMMAPRLLEIRRVLKPTGSLFLHCDPTESHGLKLMLDTIFGRPQFRNEIIWLRDSGRAKASQHKPKSFGKHYDTLLFYAATKSTTLTKPYIPLSDKELAAKFPHQDAKGRYHTGTAIFRGAGLGARPNLCYEYNGVKNPHPSGWRISKERLAELDAQGAIIWRPGKTPLRKTYAADYKGKKIGNLWSDIPKITHGKESTGYPTQKPVALLERIIRAASNEGDIVLDPFAGCATTAIAAERLGRQWAGIDISPQAAELIRYRLDKELGLAGSLAIHRTDIPARTDQGPLPAPATHKNELYGEQAGICRGCGEWFRIENFHIDHIVPRKHGGTDHRENLQLLCGHCNSRKGTGTMSELMTKLLAARRAA